MSNELANRAAAQPEADGEVFIAGYFGQRIERGERPDYGYPPNHLPEPTVDHMDLTTSYMASQDN